jgi:hypothetical protein
VAVNPKMFVKGIAIQAAAGVHNWRLRQPGHIGSQHLAQFLDLISPNSTFVRDWVHRYPQPVMGDFDDPFPGVQGKSVPTRLRNIDTVNW